MGHMHARRFGASTDANSRKRVLFVAEGVTLAHIIRPLALAQSLDPRRYEVHFACAPASDFALADAPFIRWPIESMPAEQFLRNLAAGKPLYDRQTLERYAAEEIRLLKAVQPDLVVGDLRLTLAVSAAVCRVPYAAVVNAYWSPYAVWRQYPVPEMPLVRWLGVRLATGLLRLAQPAVFAHHAGPANAVRRAYGLQPLRNLFEVLTAADYTLYADVPGLVPTENLPPTHHYLGPVLGSPTVRTPPWWNALPQGRPIVYVNLGSSGPVAALPAVLQALDGLPVTVLAATAKRFRPDQLPEGIWAADYLPGAEAARRSALVICNGGSAASCQALAEGAPVLGIAANMDQLLAIEAVERAGAGRKLRASQADSDRVRWEVEQLLTQEKYRAGVKRVREEFARYQAPSRFRALLDAWLKGPAARQPRADWRHAPAVEGVKP